MSAPATGPSAISITVAETLALLDGPHVALADGVGNGSYVLWLGSGISRGRVDGLDGVITRVLEFLQQKGQAEPTPSPHLAALEKAIGLADLRPDELAAIDIAEPVRTWPPLDVLISSLAGRYADLLDIRVDGLPADYLLWDGVDVVAAFPMAADPDCEHVAIAALVLEGVVTEAPSANWDGLIESALAELSAPSGLVRVVVLDQDLRGQQGGLRLIKFHGCTIRAADDPDTYRDGLIARASQIDDWANANETAAIRAELVSLATTRPTLMVGLSAQDPNIKAIFSIARARMNWPWPSDPPAHVFAGNQLGIDHRRILKVVYRDHYEGNESTIETSALVRAYGAQLLTALVLYVAAAKLRAFASECDSDRLSETDYDALGSGILHLRDLGATHAEPDRLAFMRAYIGVQARVLSMLRTGHDPPAGSTAYVPISNQPETLIPADAGLATSGMREFAAALGLIGREAAANGWSLGLGPTAAGHVGALRIVTPTGETSAFFAANPKAGVELEVSGAAPADADEVVVFHSTGPAARSPRSPHAHLGRTGKGGARHVDVFSIVKEAHDLPDLERRFRHEAAL